MREHYKSDTYGVLNERKPAQWLNEIQMPPQQLSEARGVRGEQDQRAEAHVFVIHGLWSECTSTGLLLPTYTSKGFIDIINARVSFSSETFSSNDFNYSVHTNVRSPLS